MRPMQDVSKALLNAADALNSPSKAPTMREMAVHAQVGLKAARYSVTNLKRAGLLQIVRDRKVSYRNRPVAEYAPSTPTPPSPHVTDSLGAVLAGWSRTR